MEVLERGKLPEEQEHIAVCFNCKSKLKFRQSEGKVTHDQRDGNFIQVECPVCHHIVTLRLYRAR